jgi:NADH-quinone oxidoreductase subunit L
MYETIVVLPLLGAIIAGVVALVGARNRYPGENPPPPHDDHAAPPVPEHVHAGPSPYAAHAVAQESHEGQPPAEPSAAGSLPAELITSTFLVIACVLSWVAFYEVGFEGQDARITIFSFITSGDLHSEWALRIDPLTAVMLVVVTTISSLVHIYSIGYMDEDPYKPRFFAYLSFFTFAMLMLVTADNLVQLFFGWEGVGLASYLLIGFWYYKPEANAAAIKAFLVNRVGDFGFSLGIFAVFYLTGAIDFDTVFAQAPSLVGKTFHFLSWDVDALTTVCLLLFMGAMGKSAQFLLHTWLPDAMEGPTPVSALIHAASSWWRGCRRCSSWRPTRNRLSSLSARPRRCSPPRSGSFRTTSSASSLIRPARSSATCSSPWAQAPIRSACSICSPMPFSRPYCSSARAR